jgi:putative membrane protein
MDPHTRSDAADGRPATAKAPGLLRTAAAGVLMGIANLIPGVSGGTMILAMGVYEEFIDSVANVTALRFTWRRVLFLVVLGGCAAGAILLLAGSILYLLFWYTSAMYALFIGLTLGGAPLLARMLRPIRSDVVTAMVVGLGLMVGVALLREGGRLPHNAGMDFVNGVVGSTTMVLPGISGSYVLLVMDQYERVVGAVDDLKGGLWPVNRGLLGASLGILIPVGIGAVLGIVGLSNLLKYLLHRHHRVTVGVLLGILLGSVLGLWPFGRMPSKKALERQPPAKLREFAAGWQIAGVEQIADAELAEHIRASWAARGRGGCATREVAAAVGLAAVGFAGTYSVSRGRSGTGKTKGRP